MTRKKTTKSKNETPLHTKTIRLANKPLTEFLVHICSKDFIEGRILRVGERKFSGTLCLQKKSSKKK